MNTYRVYRLLPLALGLLLAGTCLVLAAAPTPHYFQGIVRAVPGTSVGGDVNVHAVIGTIAYAVDKTSYLGRYDLFVPGDDPETPFVDGAVAGDLIRFFIGPPYNAYALQTATWAAGGDTRPFDLTLFSAHRFEGRVQYSGGWPAAGTSVEARRADGSLIASTTSSTCGVRQCYLLDVDGLNNGDLIRFYIGAPYNEWATPTAIYRIGGWEQYFHLKGTGPAPATATSTGTPTPTSTTTMTGTPPSTSTSTSTPTPTSTPVWCPHTFEGQTYLGVPPDRSGPSTGARIQIFGTTGESLTGLTLLAQTMVDPAGEYRFTLSESSSSRYPFLLLTRYHPGYNGVAAQSGSGGLPISATGILFEAPACEAILSGNDFWEVEEGLPLPPSATPTATATPTPTPTATATATPEPAVSWQDQTIIIQRGWGDAVVRDSYLNGWAVEQAFGAASAMGLRAGGWMRPVLWFDVSVIPADAQIKAATLKLYVESRSNTNPTGVEVRRLLRPWDESVVTWDVALTGEPWEEAGAGWPSIDCSEAIVCIAQLRTAPTWLELDLTELAREWVADPGSNVGILLRATGAAGVQYNLTASEHWYVGRRPAFVIVYQAP